MPITTSAKKALRAAVRRKVFNDRRRREMRTILKKIKTLASAGKKEEAAKLLALAQKALDKAAKTGVIKKNAAARRKSHLAHLLKK